MKQIKVKIYLVKKRKPLVTAILSNEKQLSSFKEQLNNSLIEFIDFYEITIQKSLISHITVKEI